VRLPKSKINVTTAICYFALLLGVGFGKGQSIGVGIPLICSLLVLIIIYRKHKLLAILLLITACFLIGNLHTGQFRDDAETYNAYNSRIATIYVTAVSDATYAKGSQLKFTAGDVVLEGRKLHGHIDVSGFGLQAVYQGDRLVVSGKLYAMTGASQARMSYAKLTLLKRNPSLIGTLRQKFDAGMYSALPEPLASFALGLLIGQRTTLPDDVKQDLLMVGLTHIVAVSGYNLTIMLHATRKFLHRNSKRFSTALALVLIGVFVVLTGASASIVRAAIISVFSIAASYYGRQFKPLNLILLAAAISAFLNPFYLWGDISWYLSFLAFFGVLVLAPLLATKMPQKFINSIIGTVALESICAEIMTLPYILFNFGQMSVVGLPANVLIASFVPVAMLLSLIAGVAGMLLPFFAGWLAWPAKIILNYMLDTAHFAAHLPHIFFENIMLTLRQMLVLYCLIGIVIILLKLKTKQAIYAKITDKEELSQQGAQLVRTQQVVNN
jgi:competence protein ComEC